jgi:hypothetical protein
MPQCHAGLAVHFVGVPMRAMPWANWLGAQLQEMEEELSAQHSTCGQTCRQAAP